MVQGATDARARPGKNADTTFGLFKKQEGQLGMGNKVVRLGANAKTLLVDDTEYKLTSGQWKINDYQVYKSLVEQTKFNHSRKGRALLDHTLRGNGSI